MENTIKTIDVQAKEWFDRINGNSYFSALITLNLGMKDEKVIAVPFQYGYGDKYRDAAYHQLLTGGHLGIEFDNEYYALWRYCDAKGIILRCSKKEKCLKREVLAFTQ